MAKTHQENLTDLVSAVSFAQSYSNRAFANANMGLNQWEEHLPSIEGELKRAQRALNKLKKQVRKK